MTMYSDLKNADLKHQVSVLKNCIVIHINAITKQEIIIENQQKQIENLNEILRLYEIIMLNIEDK